jgi:hypothetical protein
MRHFLFKSRVLNAALDDQIALRTEQQEMFGLIAADEDEAMARADRRGFQNLDAPPAVGAQGTAKAKAAQGPGEDGDKAKDQQQRQGEAEIGFILHGGFR